MDYRQAAQTVRDTVGMDQVLGLYGYRANRQGMMPCPFHGERHPSLKVYPKTGGWHCFGCGRGGSVIDFVREQEGCDFRTAVRALDRAFGMGLFDGTENPMDAEAERRRQKWLDEFVEAVGGILDMLTEGIERKQKINLIMVKLLEEKRELEPEKMTAEEMNLISAWRDEDDYSEYRKEKIREFREEVAAWRRKHRARPK